MDRPDFFPNSTFGWVFYSILVLWTLAASYADFRWLTVPKTITLAAWGCGFLFNIVRGAWLGGAGKTVWVCGDNGAFVGACDGLLFALCGFLVGFAIFTAMWLVGICGGGDVKLFAAVSTWVGPYFALWLLAGSTFMVVFLSMLRLIGYSLSEGITKTQRAFSRTRGKPGADGVLRPRKRLLNYSVPLAIATILLMAWFFRFDLQLAERRATPIESSAKSPIVGTRGES